MKQLRRGHALRRKQLFGPNKHNKSSKQLEDDTAHMDHVEEQATDNKESKMVKIDDTAHKDPVEEQVTDNKESKIIEKVEKDASQSSNITLASSNPNNKRDANEHAQSELFISTAIKVAIYYSIWPCSLWLMYKFALCPVMRWEC